MLYGHITVFLQILSFIVLPPIGLTPWTSAVFRFSRACRF